MPIDLTTEEARRNYHKRTLEIMAKLERTLSNQVKPLINRQYMDAASLITQGVTDVEHVVGLQRARLQTILRTHYQRVAFTAGRQATRAFDPDKSMSDSFWNEINKYIALNTGRKVKTMQDTTIKNIKNQIKIGLEDGETNREIATRLRKKGKTLSTFQALRIARTETHGMYNSATEASVNDTGLKFIRVWSTSKDIRTRRRKKGSIYDHWVADGIKAKQGEDFIVSGEPLTYPGDPKGSAGNIINCRCVLIYERDRSNEMQPKPISGALPVDVGLPVNVFKPVSSIDEAEQLAAKIGMDVSFDNKLSDDINLEYFNNHNRALSALEKAGLKNETVGKYLSVNSDPFDDGILGINSRNTKGKYGYTVYPTNINSTVAKKAFKENIDDILKGEPPIGMFTNSYEVAVHELGHNYEKLLSKKARLKWQKYYDGDGQLIVGKNRNAPSFYAQEHSGELMAESVLSHVKGIKTGSTKMMLKILKEDGLI